MPCHRLALALCAVAALVLAGGCSISDSISKSSGSFSDSSGSSSDSSGSSSGSSSGPSRYTRDVRDYTEQFVLSGGEFSNFRPRLAEIAEKRGVTNWEQDQDTYEGIGRGLKRARVSGDRLKQLENELAGPNPKSIEWMRKGYDNEKAT